MRLRWLWILPVLGLLSGCTSPVVTLYAQSLPSVRTALWDANPATDNVVVYKLQLDNGPVVRVTPSTACVGTTCSATFSVGSYGAHTLKLSATNLAVSTVPTSEQDSAPASFAFTLNPTPGVPGNGKVQ